MDGQKILLKTDWYLPIIPSDDIQNVSIKLALEVAWRGLITPEIASLVYATELAQTQCHLCIGILLKSALMNNDGKPAANSQLFKNVLGMTCF